MAASGAMRVMVAVMASWSRPEIIVLLGVESGLAPWVGTEGESARAEGEIARCESWERSARAATVMLSELSDHFVAGLEIITRLLLELLNDASEVVGEIGHFVVAQAFEKCDSGVVLRAVVLSGIASGVGQRDRYGTPVVWRGFAGDKALGLELAQQLGHGLARHAHQVGQFALGHLGLELQYGEDAALATSRITPRLASRPASALPAELQDCDFAQPLGRQAAGVRLFVFVDVVSHC